MMTLVSLYFALNESGIVANIVSLLGQMLNDPSLRYRKLTQEITMLLTVPIEMLNLNARSHSKSPTLTLQRNKKN